MSTIPVSDIVAVNPNVLSAGGAAVDLNGLVLTSSTRVPMGSVLSFPSLASVTSFFGGGAIEVTIAAKYFAGFDNSNAKPGALLFAQFNTSAVAAYLRGGNISNMSLTQLQSINGTLNVTIDAVVKTGTVNLSGATSFSNAALLIASALGIVGAAAVAFTGAISGTTLTASSVTGTFAIGDVIAGVGVTAGTYITAFGTGTGGAGTYILSTSQTVASVSMTATAPAVIYDSTSGAFIINSATTGTSSAISFGSGAVATALLLTAATGAMLSQGAAIAVPATFMNALILVNQSWALFMNEVNPDASGNALRLAFAAWTSSQNKRFGYVCSDADPLPATTLPATSSLGYLVTQAGYDGTCLVFDTADGMVNAFVLGVAASLDFTQTDGRATFKFRSQAGLIASVTDELTAINLGGNPAAGDRGNGYNFYGAYGPGQAPFSFFANGFVSGAFLWMDSFVIQIWLNRSFQIALANLLRNARTVPYNSAGRAQIEAAVADVINAGLNFGAFRAGVTLSASQVVQVNTAAGRNIATTLAQRGWYFLVQPASPDVRQRRGSPPCTFFYVDGQSVQFINLASVALQ